MNSKELPHKLIKLLEGMEWEKNNVGCSSAGVYRFYNTNHTYYLKMQPIGQGLKLESQKMDWLQGRIPVPRKKYFIEDENFEYLLMTEIEGDMTCSDSLLKNPEEVTKILADGIKMLQRVSITDCPYDNSLEIKLNNARHLINNNLVDMSDWEQNNEFATPIELYEHLKMNKPKDYTPVFSHGDYCLPNIFCKNQKVSGFIDLGRSGIADMYQDIALCVRSIRHNFNNEEYVNMFFHHLGIEPDWGKIEYYILLDELF